MEDLEEIYREQLRGFFISEEKVREHLEVSDLELHRKKHQLDEHVRQLNQVREEMQKTYMLYQQNEISPQGFGKIYRPLEERENGLSRELPKLQGAYDALVTNSISASAVVAEANTLHKLWPDFDTEQKRKIIENITEKIVFFRRRD